MDPWYFLDKIISFNYEEDEGEEPYEYLSEYPDGSWSVDYSDANATINISNDPQDYKIIEFDNNTKELILKNDNIFIKFIIKIQLLLI